MTLHILSQSPTHSACTSCLKHAADGETIILIGDGVYLLPALHASKPLACTRDLTFFALADDAKTRGLVDDRFEQQMIDYPTFVALTSEHNPVQSWY